MRVRCFPLHVQGVLLGDKKLKLCLLFEALLNYSNRSTTLLLEKEEDVITRLTCLELAMSS